MDAQLQYGSSTNPFIQNMNQQMASMSKQFADDYLRKSQIEAYKNRALLTTKKEEPKYTLPTLQDIESGKDFTPSETFTEVDAQNAQNLPKKEVNFTENINGLDGAGVQENESFISTKELTIPTTPPSKEDTKSVADFRSKSVEDQNKEQQQVTIKPNQASSVDGTIFDFQDIPGIPFAGVVGKNKRSIPTVTEQYSEKEGKKLTVTRQAENDFDIFSNNATIIGTRISNNKKLMDLFNAADKNWNNVSISSDTDVDGNPIAVAFVKGEKFEYPLTTVEIKKDTLPEAFGEVQMIEFVKNIVPIAKKNNWSLIEEEPTAAAEAPAETQGGLPATQFTTTAPQIPEEAMALQKLVEQGQVAKAGESAKNVEKRIKDIDSQIKKLSAPIFQFGGTTSASGVKTREEKRIKTPEEAEADIQKIIKLKEQKSMLSAQSEGRVFATEEEAKRSTKKFGKGTIIYIAGKPAKVQ
jgi:hypothetical protein